MLVQRTIRITGAGTNAVARQADGSNKKAIFKRFLPFTDCISEVNNTQINDAKYLDIVMPMYSLVEYNDNYSKTSGNYETFCRDEPNDTKKIAKTFKLKVRITGKAPVDGNAKDVEVDVPFNNLSNYRRTPEMPLINCQITAMLT